MMSVMTARYERALRELTENLGQTEELADLLDYFAGLLRGYPPELEGPPLERYPSLWQVRRALQRRSGIIDAAVCCMRRW